MVRVITQETYDEVVKENMDEFEMGAEEAINEAIAQFEAQGVNLSNIIKDLALGGGGDHLVSTALGKLKELKLEQQNDLILKQLDVLKSECSKDIARRVRAGKEGAYTLLITYLQEKLKVYKESSKDEDAKFILSILSTLIALMDVQPDLLDDEGMDLIISTLDTIQNESIIVGTLLWTNVCCTKHEMNRQKLFSKNISKNLKIFLKSKNSKVLKGTLQVIRKLTYDDDIRVPFGKAHDHAKEMGASMLETITGLLKEHQTPPLVSELMKTSASLLVRNELCALVADCGVDHLFTILADNYDDAAVIQQAMKLITALAGNDDVKRALVKSGIVPVIITLVTRHSSSAATLAPILKCIAALTLREPEHSQQFLDNGGPEAIVDALKIHMENDAVVKNACWAIRNMVARCREYNPKFHELGIEDLLNKAYEKYGKDFGFDIKSALSDLECDVKFEEQWKGKGGEIDN